MAQKRDASGRFAKGHDGGPGRPKKAREQRYYEITQSACTFQDWRDIVKRAVEDAKKGDTSARKFLADYLIGPPVQKQEISGGLTISKGYIGFTPDEWEERESEDN